MTLELFFTRTLEKYVEVITINAEIIIINYYILKLLNLWVYTS